MTDILIRLPKDIQKYILKFIITPIPFDLLNDIKSYCGYVSRFEKIGLYRLMDTTFNWEDVLRRHIYFIPFTDYGYNLYWESYRYLVRCQIRKKRFLHLLIGLLSVNERKTLDNIYN